MEYLGMRFTCQNLIFIIPLAGFLSVISSGCIDIGNSKRQAEAEEEKNPFPIFRTLTDTQGRTIEAEIIGRSFESITLIRLTDRKTFTIPITNLSSADQNFLLQLPIYEQAPRVRQKQELTGYAKILQSNIDDKRAEIDQLRQEQATTPRNSIKGRSIYSKLMRLESELGKLNAEMQSLK